MKKIVYLIVLGFFMIIPKTVFAGYNAFNFKAPTFYIENGLKQQIQLPTTVISYSGGQYYTFSASSSDFGNSSTLMHFTTQIAIQGNFDPSKYDSMIISIYGTPIYDFQADSGTCIPYGSIGGMDMDSNFIVSTYVCQVPTSSTVWLDAYMTPNLNFALRMNDRITFIEKNTDTSNVAGAINKQTEEMMKAMEEQNKTQQETNDLISGDSEKTEDKSCGIICKLKGIFSGIIELPGKLVSLLIDALKSLFVPTDEQLYEIINDSKDLAENFGFVGETINFFITIFTSLLGMVNANGCIELPEFTIGATSLFDSFTFWQAQNVCLNDNVVLSSNINTIRTITSIVLVVLFINFAARQFFNILNKNDNGSESISYDPRTGEVRE